MSIDQNLFYACQILGYNVKMTFLRYYYESFQYKYNIAIMFARLMPPMNEIG